jgi:hypothetical protein
MSSQFTNGYSPADLAAKPSADSAAPVHANMAAEVAALLDRLPDLPTPAHVEVFDAVQQKLSDTLSSVDEA